MKLHEFGLWFWEYDERGNKWSTSIPQRSTYSIWYDGEYLGVQWEGFPLRINNDSSRIIKLKKHFPYDYLNAGYQIGYRLTPDDFDIIPNTDYKGDK